MQFLKILDTIHFFFLTASLNREVNIPILYNQHTENSLSSYRCASYIYNTHHHCSITTVRCPTFLTLVIIDSQLLSNSQEVEWSCKSSTRLGDVDMSCPWPVSHSQSSHLLGGPLLGSPSLEDKMSKMFLVVCCSIYLFIFSLFNKEQAFREESSKDS